MTRSVTDSSGTTLSSASSTEPVFIGKGMGAFRAGGGFHRARARDAGRIALVPRGVLMEPTKTGDRRVRADPELLLLVSRWRGRAQEILARAETMRDAWAQQMMREAGARDERLAQRIETGS